MVSAAIDAAITAQISLFASSPTAATILVTVLDCLAIYAATLPLRKKASQTEFSLLLFGVVFAVLIVLELIGGAR